MSPMSYKITLKRWYAYAAESSCWQMIAGGKKSVCNGSMRTVVRWPNIVGTTGAARRFRLFWTMNGCCWSMPNVVVSYLTCLKAIGKFLAYHLRNLITKRLENVLSNTWGFGFYIKRIKWKPSRYIVNSLIFCLYPLSRSLHGINGNADEMMSGLICN